MLSKDNFSEKHIRDLQNISRRDPVLLERAIYAFGLLEALIKSGMPFVFKGGTCQMLLLDHPMRLSTDIDIVVEPGTDIDEYIRKASVIFLFLDYTEQKRMENNNIEKGILNLFIILRSMTTLSIFCLTYYSKKAIMKQL